MTMNGLTLAELQQDINDVIEMHEADLAKTEGGGAIEIPEGTALAVITGYVEMGSHTNKKGDSKPRAKVFFELFDLDDSTSDYTRKIKLDDGTEKTVGAHITHNLHNISRNEKAGFRKDMDAMFTAVGMEGESTPLKLLGKTIMVDVVHTQSEDGKTTYTNLKVSECKAPFECNRAGKPDLSKPLTPPVNPASLPMRVFLFNAPTPLQWSTIFIDGEYEVEGKDGKKETKSKNWIQETIKNADNFAGSAVEAMLLQAGNSGTALPKATKAKDTETVTESAPVVEKVAEEVPVTESEPVSEAASGLTPEENAELLKMREIKSMLETMGTPTDDVDAKIAALEAKQ